MINPNISMVHFRATEVLLYVRNKFLWSQTYSSRRHSTAIIICFFVASHGRDKETNNNGSRIHVYLE